MADDPGRDEKAVMFVPTWIGLKESCRDNPQSEPEVRMITQNMK
jgi:hypothetical protein